MKEHTAAEKRFFENATVIGALRVIFGRLSEANVPLSPLSEIADTSSGGTPDRNNSSYYGGSIPWMKSGELTDREVTKIEETITELGLANSSAKVFPVGTLLIALYGATVGKTGILGVEAASNQAVCAVLPRTQNVCVRYLYWFLRRKREEFLQMSFGGAQPNISQKILRDTLVPLPSLSVQETIASFLDAVEKRLRDQSIPLPELPAPLSEQRRVVARIEELSAQIHEARTLRHQATQEAELLFQTSLTAKLDSSKWPVRLLPEVASLARGKFDHRPRNEPRFFGGEYPFIQIGDLSKCTRYVRTHSQSLNADGLAISRMFPKGTVAIAITGATIGVTRILGFDSCFPDSIVGIQANPEDAIPEFIYLAVEHAKKSALAEATQTTQPNINLGNLQRLQVCVPPLAEQRRIVAELDALQAEVDALKRLQAETSAELDALLPAILDRAFKGEL